MEDGLQLNIDFDAGKKARVEHLDWRERKKKARERQAQKRRGFRNNQHGKLAGAANAARPGTAAATVAAAAGTQQEHGDIAQQHNQTLHAKGATGNAQAHAAKKRPAADSLHGYGDLLKQGQQQQQQQDNKVPEAAAFKDNNHSSTAYRRPAKRPNVAETAAAAVAAAEAMTADEAADIMALVHMNKTLDQQLEEEEQQQQQQAGKNSKKRTGREKALQGVVEFGDAPDEPDAQVLLAKAAKFKGGSSKHKDRTSDKEQQQQKQGMMAQQKLAQHSAGELVHAEPNVPAEQRQQLFGEAAAAAAGSGVGSWSGLGLCDVLADHLTALNFQEPTQVQQRAIPVLLSGRDALVRSPTGSGKTLAYLAPLIQQLQASQPRVSRADGTRAVVLVPTRELAVQVSDVLTALVRRFVWIVSGMLIGGEHRGHEKARLRKGVTVLVATPGRLLDHLQSTKSFKTDKLSWLILDEADRLLDLGFEAKLKEIVQAMDTRGAAAGDEDNSYAAATAAADAKHKRQTVLLSATLHPRLSTLAGLSMQNPVGVGFEAKLVDGQLQLLAAEHDDSAQQQGKFELPQQLQQKFVEVPAKFRLVSLIGLLLSRLRRRREAKMVVFFSSCDSVDFAHALLLHQQGDDGANEAASGGWTGPLLGGCPVLKLHGDMRQPERTSSLVTFAKAKSCVLLCTDVAARGLDFPSVTTIVQYDPAGDPAEYVHRVGRTARMGQQGEALLFLLPSEMQYAELLQQQGARLAQEQLANLLQCLPGLAGTGGPSVAVQHLARKMRKADSISSDERKAGPSFDGVEGLEGAKPEQAAAVVLLQRQLVAAVARDAELSRMATKAFRSFVRAYTTYPSSLKHVFYIKSLHLGHIAASFGLREAPTKIGAAGSAAERKKRKLQEKDAATKREKKAWHKNAKAAAALGQ